MRLWYTCPTTVSGRCLNNNEDDGGDWQNRALPIGNSHMGAMLAGQLVEERVQFNEKTLWEGGPCPSRPNYRGGNKDGDLAVYLENTRQALLKGEAAHGKKLADQYLVGNKEGYGTYLNFGWLNITHRYEGGMPTEDSVSHYVRELDLETAVGSSSFIYCGVKYQREYFMSYPDLVLVARHTASETGKLTMDIAIMPNRVGPEITTNQAGDDGRIRTFGSLADNGLRWECQLQIIPIGGTMSASGSTVTISGANEVLFVMSAATDYQNIYPSYRSGVDPMELVTARVDAATEKGYSSLYATHYADYSKLFGRVTLALGEKASNLPTDTLLEQYKAGTATRELEILLFQYGRYLLIASSRGKDLPANLQGVWNDMNSPIWSCDYHTNVNLQMNYWPVYSTNLKECAEPLIHYIDSLRAPGRMTAKTYMGIASDDDHPENGYTFHTQNTPFGWTCPGWLFSWGWSPAAVPWVLQNVWEYYEYSGDVKYLKNTLYPMLREQAVFWQQYLSQGEDGYYYSAPVFSPEHGPYTFGNVYEHVLVRQLLKDTAKAASILGVDEALRDKWLALQGRIRGEEIGQSRQIKEWFDETTLGNNEAGAISGYQPRHRHMSHLLGLYPGNSISVETPQLLKAATVSLDDRGDSGPTITGWAMGQRLLCWARVQDGNRAHKLIQHLLCNGIHENLFNTHPPFQIDGNFAYTAGVAEMLLQSNLGYIQPLAALPSAWPMGSVSGLVARGNFILSIQWSENTLTTLTVHSINGGECRIKYVGFAASTKVLCGGESVPGSWNADGVLVFDTNAGSTYSIFC